MKASVATGIALAGGFFIAAIACAAGFMTMMPGKSFKGALPPLSAEETVLRDRLRRHVTTLAQEIGERNMRHYDALQQAARYISKELRDAGLSVRELTYQVQGKPVSNIEVEIKGTQHADKIVVVGAHYDSVLDAPGANDNGSGVAAVLELARHFRDAKPERTLRFVAFVNEEPPWFFGDGMGSLVYAREAKKRGEKIVAMLSVETIGYYSDARNSQHYPAPFQHLYPDTGNFIAIVSDLNSRALLHEVIGAFRRTTQFPSEGVAAPDAIEGIGWSDHWSFWQEGYPALMFTDTALFRYPWYHEAGDTPDKLDYDRMARVTTGIGNVVRELTESH